MTRILESIEDRSVVSELSVVKELFTQYLGAGDSNAVVEQKATKTTENSIRSLCFLLLTKISLSPLATANLIPLAAGANRPKMIGNRRFGWSARSARGVEFGEVAEWSKAPVC